MERLLKVQLRHGRFTNVSPERSRIMSSIRGKRNKTTETALRMALVRSAVSGWSLHPPDLPGHPDFYFSAFRLAIFVDGCFWHGCPRCGHFPKTNSNFWRLKIKRNIERDTKAHFRLRRRGIRVVRFWEHDLRDSLADCVAKLRTCIRGCAANKR
ncbi:MAG: very short patch repair endonuclease [Candidatus Sulfotelmatobacter sp.]|jgi:DNA mismatch endonuclease, patch repair protein